MLPQLQGSSFPLGVRRSTTASHQSQSPCTLHRLSHLRARSLKEQRPEFPPMGKEGHLALVLSKPSGTKEPGLISEGLLHTQGISGQVP